MSDKPVETTTTAGIPGRQVAMGDVPVSPAGRPDYAANAKQIAAKWIDSPYYRLKGKNRRALVRGKGHVDNLHAFQLLQARISTIASRLKDKSKNTERLTMAAKTRFFLSIAFRNVI